MKELIDQPGNLWGRLPLKENTNNGITGTLVLDVDGTITRPGTDYIICPKAVCALTTFLLGGGSLVFCTGATTARIERSVLNPLFDRVAEPHGMQTANDYFKNISVLPENGSALLLSKSVSVEENELRFDWYKIHELHVPDKERLRKVLEERVVPTHAGSFIAGDQHGDRVRRDYMLSLKNVSDTFVLKDQIVRDLTQTYPDIDWSKIALKAARTSIDFVHADSGKTVSVLWLFKELSSLYGPVLGFGDLGDEFARLIPTFNVNTLKPNEFRRRDMPAIDVVGGWNRLDSDQYVLTGQGPDVKIIDKKTGKEVPVVRDRKGCVVFAQSIRKNHRHYLSPTTPDLGHPFEIKPFTVEGETLDAGTTTAWIINYLINRGYFSK